MLTSDIVEGLSVISAVRDCLVCHLQDHEKGEFCKDTMICLEADDVRQFMEGNTKLQKENIELKKQLQDYVLPPQPISVTETISFLNEQNHNLAMENTKLRQECIQLRRELDSREELIVNHRLKRENIELRHQLFAIKSTF